ncbi:MAG: hypothetical protein MJA27_34525, partial [Pseudanabaenales cyanobacterium]|nr:hypothetical protein [Pseudanabaenales cyanobacterium]
MRVDVGGSHRNAALAIEVDRCVFDDGVYGAAGGFGVLQALNQNCPNTFGAEKAVRPVAERPDRRTGGQLADLGQHPKRIGQQEEIGRPNDGPINQPQSDGGESSVQRHGESSTGGVNHLTGSGKIKMIRDPVGDHAV